MIVVTEVKFIEVNEQDAYLAHYEEPIPVWTGGAEKINPEKYITTGEVREELIQGTRFKRPDGTEIVLGISSSAKKVLGLGYEVFSNQRRTIETLHSNVLYERNKRGKAENQLFLIKHAGFWTRLKWLFTGVQNEQD